MSEELELRFEWERETKNTVRFRELADEEEHVVGSLYVSKAAIALLGDPQHLLVSIRSAGVVA